MNRINTLIVVIVITAIIALAGGWYLWRPAPPKPETYAVEQTQNDGSTILERKPDDSARPEHQIPKGAKVERIVSVTVKAKPVETTPVGIQEGEGGIIEKKADCPPVKVDMSLVRMPDDTRRVVASSPDGEVVGGVDIPVEAAKPERKLLWSAGLMFNPLDKRYGGYVDRKMGPFVVGGQILQAEGGLDFWIKGGIQF